MPNGKYLKTKNKEPNSLLLSIPSTNFQPPSPPNIFLSCPRLQLLVFKSSSLNFLLLWWWQVRRRTLLTFVRFIYLLFCCYVSCCLKWIVSFPHFLDFFYFLKTPFFSGILFKKKKKHVFMVWLIISLQTALFFIFAPG